MTSFFLKLLGANIPDAFSIDRASLAFRGLNLGWIFFWFLLLGAFIYWQYKKSPSNLTPTRKYTLTCLRIGFITLVLLLLLRPVLAITVEGSIRRAIIFLIDTSASMQMKDNRIQADDQHRAALATGLLDAQKGLQQSLDRNKANTVQQIARLDLLKAALKNERIDLLPRLDKEFDLDVFTFGQTVAPISAHKENSPAPSDADRAKLNSLSPSDGERAGVRGKPTSASIDQFTWIDTLTATNPATAIGDALHDVMDRKRGQPLAGVVLVTDGANNSGSQPREIASLLKQEGLPLYIYGVGITSPRDIIVGNVFAPDISFVKDEIPVTVRVRAQNLNGEYGVLTLKMNGQTVATRGIDFTNDTEMVIPMNFVPDNPGEYDLVASIDPRPDEPPENNVSRPHHLRVIDAKIKVLMIEQAPRWEFRYLQAMLLRDRRVELKCLLLEADPAIARAAPPLPVRRGEGRGEGSYNPYIAQFPVNREELFKFDLVIFGDVSPKYISLTQMEMLSQWVSDFGGAFVMVAGKRYTPNAYRRTPFEKLLPVEFDPAPPESSLDPTAEKPIHLELTAAGRANPMLRLADNEQDSLDLWKQLPPVYWVAKVSRPKPAAEVFLVDPDPAKESRFGKMPVIALQQYGLGQVLYVGTDNTWRWRRNAGDIYYTTLWGQIAQRVSAQRFLGGSRRIQLTSDRQNYMTGERVSIYARLYNVGFEPLQDSSVRGFYTLKNGQGPRPEITLRSVPEQPGLYRAEFIAPAAGNYQFWVEQDPNHFLDFNVTPPAFEMGETAMNQPLLKDLAAATAGAFFREEDLYKLPNVITQKTEHVRSPIEIELWASPFYFLLMLGLLTTEWVLRKTAYLK